MIRKYMERKWLLGMTLLSISMSSWSAGPYMGLGLGSDLIDFHQKARVFQLSNFDVIDKSHLAASGIFGSLFAGYARNYNWFYIAAEVNGNLSSTRFKSSNDEFIHQSFVSTTYKINSNYGISILPGVLFAPSSLIYARFGYANGHFKSITSDVSLQNLTKNLDGFRVGLGLKQMITPNWGLRFEYSHINYEKVKFSAFDNSTTKLTNIDPYSNQFEFAIVYSFDRPRIVAVDK